MVPEIFAEILKLSKHMGVARINELPGCWEVSLPDGWRMAMNGKPTATKASSGVEVPPFEAYFEFNGWPAGFVGMNGGVVAAGDAANEESLLASLRAARGES